MVNLDRHLLRPQCVLAFTDSGGDGPPVVLLHGAGLDHSMFDDQIGALTRSGFRVIAMDLRGHGESALDDGARFDTDDALDDLAAVLEECALAETVLVGHSLGGNLVQAFVEAQPNRVRGAIVMDSTWNAGPLSWIERVGLRLAAPTLALVPARRLPRLIARASAVTPEAILKTEAVFSRMPKAGFIDVWRATVSLVQPVPHRRFPVPLALVRGAEDGTGNIADAMRRWAEADSAREHVIPGAGHIVTWDAPERTSNVLVEILDGWSRGRARPGGPS